MVIGGRDEDRGREVVDGIVARGGQAVLRGRGHRHRGDQSAAGGRGRRTVRRRRYPGAQRRNPRDRRRAGRPARRVATDDRRQPERRLLPDQSWPRPSCCSAAAAALSSTDRSAAYKGFPNHPAYCASKGALVPLVRQLALDLAPTIRVNILCPGQVDTPLLWDSAKAFPSPRRPWCRRSPLACRSSAWARRRTSPRRRCSWRATTPSWITGAALTIDGGIMAGGG